METLFHFMMQEGVNHGTSPSLNTHKLLHPPLLHKTPIPRGYIFSSSKNYKKIFSTLLTIVLFYSLYNNPLLFFSTLIK